MKEQLYVTSHVSRDFLQNAAYFNTLPKVVWEYVSNSLDNAREDCPVIVVVEVNRDECLRVSDNGTGMSRADLKRFFTMHGENIQRKRGKRVRGRFGTGKSAAFGIAKLLKIETRQNGKRNVVSLHLDDIKKVTSGKPFYVNEIAVDEPTDEEDGTIVEISEFMIPRFDTEAVVSYAEKHMARYRLRANVIINGHTCRFREPPSIHEVSIDTTPEIERIIGKAKLVIKTAPFNLEQDERGVDILSDGIWHETTLGEVDGREFSERLFGEIDVPLLESVDDDIAPFDNTRNNVLNRANPRVVVLIGWISQELEKVRQQLTDKERERKKTEQAIKLQEEARKMAEIINEDFTNLMIELEAAQKITGRSKKHIYETIADEGSVFPGQGKDLSNWQESGQSHGDGSIGSQPPGNGETPRPGSDLIPGQSEGSPRKAAESGNARKNRSSLFSIEFAHHTEEYPRSRYDRGTHTIYINLDHPQVVAAQKEGGGSLDSRYFLSMVYEIASVEYAQAIPFERIQQGEAVDAADALFAVGETIDRISRRFAIKLG